ncbi:MAG: DUF2807 domain-containing protein [Corallococcus sp.]|nr:DUF2807 domain-containing protein [Corallococcus sp.]
MTEKLQFARLENFVLKNVECKSKINIGVVGCEEHCVCITCDGKDFKKLKIKRTENICEISASKFSTLKNLEIEVTSDALSAVSVAGACVLDFAAPIKTIKFAFAGDISANIACGSAESVNMLLAGSEKVCLCGSTENLSITGSGSCELCCSGNCENGMIKSSGSIKLKANSFVCGNLALSTSGAAICQVNAAKNLTLKMSGFGKVDYEGDADVSCEVSGAVEVNRINRN